jgi:hypothetical protein
MFPSTKVVHNTEKTLRSVVRYANIYKYVCECERLARIDTLRWGSSRHGKTFLALTGKRKVVASVCLCPPAAAATRHHAEHAEHAEGHRHSTCTPPTAALSRSIA